MEIKKFAQYNETKVKEFEQEPLSNDIELVEVDGEKVEDFDFKEFEIESIIDVIVPNKDDKEFGNELEIEESVTTVVGPGAKDYKRGDTIYISALIRKKGTTSFNSAAKTAVLKCRITDIYFGLQYLKKVIN